MTQALFLGSEPANLGVLLPRGGEFVASLQTSDGLPWPVGLIVMLEFAKDRRSTATTVWPALVSGALIKWEVSVEMVALVVNASPSLRSVAIVYDGGLGRRIWTRGEVRVV